MAKGPGDVTYSQETLDKLEAAIDSMMEARGPLAQYAFSFAELRTFAGIGPTNIVEPLIQYIKRVYGPKPDGKGWQVRVSNGYHAKDGSGESSVVIQRPNKR